MQKVSVFFVLSVLFFLNVSFMKPPKEHIQWLSIAEAKIAYSKLPKPILIDVYTSWCGWCKVMDKQTYANDQVANYINEKYYAVKFDAENKDAIEWNGKEYHYDVQNKVNELAIYLLNGQLSYPCTVFLVSPDGKPAPLPGFMKPKEIEAPLKFFGEGHYKANSFPVFFKDFKGNW